MQFHLLGTVGFEACLALQRRLVYEAGGAGDGRIVVLLCEHQPLISIGRLGSRGHIQLTSEELRARQLATRWVGRGGGCILHVPGQLAIYPIVPLAWYGWTVGHYLRSLQSALATTLSELRIPVDTVPTSFGLWGRTGLLAAVGVAVQGAVTCHGAFLNVHPPMTHFSRVHTIDPRRSLPHRKTTMGCLLSEQRRAVTMPKVRAALVPNLAAAFGTDQYHMLTGHPWLPETRRTPYPCQGRAS